MELVNLLGHQPGVHKNGDSGFGPHKNPQNIKWIKPEFWYVQLFVGSFQIHSDTMNIWYHWYMYQSIFLSFQIQMPWIYSNSDTLWQTYKKQWKLTIFMGQLIVSMAIFNSYVILPEATASMDWTAKAYESSEQSIIPSAQGLDVAVRQPLSAVLQTRATKKH